MLKTFYHLTKPGLVRGNLVNAAAGFFLASRGHFDWWLLGATLVGLGLVVAAACVGNNYFDRDIDAKMERTKERALVRGSVSKSDALGFAGVIGVAGVFILFLFANPLAAGLALLGMTLYLWLYTPLKRTTHWAAEAGSLAGAMPPLVGYTAVTSALDLGALLLFLLFVVWQLPHFFAIALYRKHEYEAAGVPVRSIARNLYETKVYMLGAVAVFGALTTTLYYAGLVGPAYILIMAPLCLGWFVLALGGLFAPPHQYAKGTLEGYVDELYARYASQWFTDTPTWAKQMFRYSLLVVVALCLALMLQR